MQENEFEKKVQQKIDGLKINPSNDVWQKVASAITKDKSDRRVLVLILLLLVFTASTIFIIGNLKVDKKTNKLTVEKNTPAQPNKINQPINATNSQQTVVEVDKLTNGTTINGVGSSEIIKDNVAVKKISYQKKLLVLSPEAKKITANKMYEVVKNNSIENKNDVANKPLYKTRQKLSAVIQNGNATDSLIEDKTTDKIEENSVEEISSTIKEVAVNEIGMDTVSEDKINLKIQLKDSLTIAQKNTSKKEIAVKIPQSSKQKNKWRMGFNFSVGAAATQNGYLGVIGLTNSSLEKASYDANRVAANNIATGPVAVLFTPSKIKASTGFVLGVFAQKNISTKINFLVGLNYKMVSSIMTVGNRVNDALMFNTVNNSLDRRAFFYQSGYSNSYKNNFHFIELPLSVHIKLGKQNKVPIYLNTGVSVAQLISTSALQFNKLTGEYYSDNDLLNKTNFNLSAGLLFSLFRRAKNPILIGPDINFSVNKMATTGLYSNRRYSFFGLRLQKSFGKK